jgi:hypothetical protein
MLRCSRSWWQYRKPVGDENQLVRPGRVSHHHGQSWVVVGLEGGWTMSTRWIASACLLALAACASPPKPVSVLVVEDENRVRGCRPLGTVADNHLDDLQKKAARVGGNVALMTPQHKTKGGYFNLQEYMTADVYHCEASR